MRGFDPYFVSSAVLSFYVFPEGENYSKESKRHSLLLEHTPADFNDVCTQDCLRAGRKTFLILLYMTKKECCIFVLALLIWSKS